MDGSSLGLWGVPLAMLAGAIRVSTPFIFVSIGECLTERSGRINLGLEGTLMMGRRAGGSRGRPVARRIARRHLPAAARQ